MLATTRSRLLRRTVVALTAVLACLAGVLLAPGSAAARPQGAAAAPVPPTPKDLPADIEPARTPYVAQDSCDPVFKPGTRRLIRLLHRTYPDVSAQGAYACGTDGSTSEHYDGRAIDWMASVDNRQQHAEALAFIDWLLAPDAQGNHHAMARRLGVMYLIYDNRIWGAWGGGKWEPYNDCAKHPQAAYDNSCHRTHVHISLTWNGAMGRTSYWTGQVTPTDYGPCRGAGLAWAAPYAGYNPKPCRNTPGPRLPADASAQLKELAKWSGRYLHDGSSGPGVSALQAVLGVSVTGEFGAVTESAVRAFQRSRGLPATGRLNRATWRALLPDAPPAPAGQPPAQDPAPQRSVPVRASTDRASQRLLDNTAAALGHAKSRRVSSSISVWDWQTRTLYNGGRPLHLYAAGSLVDVFVAVELLATGQMDGWREQAARAMIAGSDGSARATLLPLVGGADVIDRVMDRYHVKIGRAPTNGDVENTQVCAAGLALFYAKVVKDPQVWPWLSRTLAGAGRPFGIPAAARSGQSLDRAATATKQAWVRADTYRGRTYTEANSTGFLAGGRFTVVILATGPARFGGDDPASSHIGRTVSAEAQLLMPDGHLV